LKQFTRWIQRQYEKSNIISGFLAFAIWGTICYLAATGHEIPTILATAGGAIIMFFYEMKKEASE